MSTIKVDTYLTRGGASEIAIDKLKGVTAAATINVVAEGGTNTTNLQQGLLKAWGISNDGANTADSFNIGSATDNGTGNYTKAFTTNMASANSSITATSAENQYGTMFSGGRLAANFIIKCENISGAALDSVIAYKVAGDLA